MSGIHEGYPVPTVARLAVVLGLLWAVAGGPPAGASDRGISVQIRTADDPTAPVSETVRLYGASHALVIGIDAYQGGWPKLRNAVADARAVAAELEGRGFDVTLKEDLDSSALQAALKEFFAIQGADPDARLFLWYAGHGHTIKGEGFLVPTDAPPPLAPEFKLKAIHMRDFGGLMRLADAKHVFAVFDSCFAGTIFEARAGAIPAAITRKTTQPVRQFLSSGDADQTVSDDGSFRKLFLRALTGEERADANGDGYLTGSELGMYLTDRVTNLTEQAQTPRYGKLRDPDFDRGDLVFLLPEQAVATSRPRAEGAPGEAETEAGDEAAAAQAAIVEITLWASVAASEDPAEVQTYLDAYPQGRFAAVAKRRIAALEEAAQAEAQGEAVVSAQPQPEEPALKVESGSQAIVALEPEAGGAQWWQTLDEEPGEAFQLQPAEDLADVLPAGGERSAQPPAGRSVPEEAWQFSNPQGDGLYKVAGEWVHMRANGGRNLWDCRRYAAPLLSTETPRSEDWTAVVRFKMPSRVGRSQVGLMVWNGREERPVHHLVIGPTETGEVQVAGAYTDDCSAGAGDLPYIAGNRGAFATAYAGTEGWLRISKRGHRLHFYFRAPLKHDWQELGSVLTTRKDGFDRLGLLTKTWGNQPVQVSFGQLRVFPGVADLPAWRPAYLDALRRTPRFSFRGEAYADFEWSDPRGDSLYEVTDDSVRLVAQGGHNTWDCRRGDAPVLSVAAPPAESWSAQVRFEMPTRAGRSHVGLALWNGREDRPVHTLILGPAETDSVAVGGSYRDDCTGGSGDLARILDNEGPFVTHHEGATGWLRIDRKGDLFELYFRSPNKKAWQRLGRLRTTYKDGFERIGLLAKTWGSDAVEARFSDFTLSVGRADASRWVPGYFSGLSPGEPHVFSGRSFADFEWSDPQGDSVHEIRGRSVLLRTGGSHNMWDCRRGNAPMLTVEAPPQETWVAQVRYRMPKRVNRTHLGLVVWDGREDRPVNALYFGPASTREVAVSGSYRDDCSAGAGDLAKIEGNTGPMTFSSDATQGLLRVAKTDATFRFWARPEGAEDWQALGQVLTTIKDDLGRVGFMAKSWGPEGVEVTFSDFTVLPGGWQ